MNVSRVKFQKIINTNIFFAFFLLQFIFVSSVFAMKPKFGAGEEKLREAYKGLWKSSRQSLFDGKVVADPAFGPKKGDLGISLVYELNQSQVRDRVNEIIEKLKEIDPEHYYYPEVDRHGTVIAFDVPSEEFALKKDKQDTRERIGKYKKIVAKVLNKIAPFWVSFAGLTASKSAVMLEGYPENSSSEIVENSMEVLRDAIREVASKEVLGLREQYAKGKGIFTHSCFIRFKKDKLENPEKFVKIFEQEDKALFEEPVLFKVDKMKLSILNWLNEEKRREVLGEYELAGERLNRLSEDKLEL